MKKQPAKKGRPRKQPEDKRVRLSVRVLPETRRALDAWSRASGDGIGRIVDALVEGRDI